MAPLITSICNIGLQTSSYILYKQTIEHLEDRSQTNIQVKILSMLGSKLDEQANFFKTVKFNISANLEEVERGTKAVSLNFIFTIVTDPRVVKYQIEGRTMITGQLDNIKKALTPHPSTKVPMVLYDIYQQVYTSLFVLSKSIDAPSPSPELLSTSPPIPSTLSDIQELSEEQITHDEEISV